MQMRINILSNTVVNGVVKIYVLNTYSNKQLSMYAERYVERVGDVTYINNISEIANTHTKYVSASMYSLSCIISAMSWFVNSSGLCVLHNCRTYFLCNFSFWKFLTFVATYVII